MVRVDCECPLNTQGTRHVHAITCPNRKRGKGAQPKDYTDRARIPRTWQHARLAIEQLRDDLHALCVPGQSLLWARLVASARLQTETVRRYLDGE